MSAAGGPRVWFAAMRPRQWTKNAVVLAAFVFALGDPGQHATAALAWRSLAAMLLFCLLSSGVYVLNDVRDREHDRQHPVKRGRPVASGALPVRAALALAAALLVLGLAGAALLAPVFLAVAAGYVVMQVVYTVWLKHVPLLDVFVIAAGFVLRALGGGVAIGVQISAWLLLCAMLLALFLALCKRRHEKVQLGDLPAATRPSLAHYDEKVLDQLIAVVSAATLVCYAIYTLWPETVEKFGTRGLAFTIPFVIFGLFRYLDLVYRHDRGDAPEQILLTDGPLLVDLALYGAAVLLVLLAR